MNEYSGVVLSGQGRINELESTCSSPSIPAALFLADGYGLGKSGESYQARERRVCRYNLAHFNPI